MVSTSLIYFFCCYGFNLSQIISSLAVMVSIFPKWFLLLLWWFSFFPKYIVSLLIIVSFLLKYFSLSYDSCLFSQIVSSLAWMFSTSPKNFFLFYYNGFLFKQIDFAYLQWMATFSDRFFSCRNGLLLSQILSCPCP